MKDNHNHKGSTRLLLILTDNYDDIMLNVTLICFARKVDVVGEVPRRSYVPREELVQDRTRSVISITWHASCTFELTIFTGYFIILFDVGSRDMINSCTLYLTKKKKKKTKNMKKVKALVLYLLFLLVWAKNVKMFCDIKIVEELK